MTTRKSIDNFCKKLDHRRFMPTYGKVFIVSTKKVLILLDVLLPAVWLLVMFIPERYDWELARISRRNE